MPKGAGRREGMCVSAGTPCSAPGGSKQDKLLFFGGRGEKQNCK